MLYWRNIFLLLNFDVLGKDNIFHLLLSGATTDNLGPGVLYQVKASYKYQAEDVDELNFEVGEVIDVVEYDDPEEQVNKVNKFI